MSNRRKPSGFSTDAVAGDFSAALRCPDCASTVGTCWRGPVLSFELEHSDSCPVWPHKEHREFLAAFGADEATIIENLRKATGR